MGKRSTFERVPRDFYRTPAAAVPPLIPFLRGVRSFAEPCCGDGALVRHLESFGLRCTYQGDIAAGQDPLARNAYGDIDAIITNPPWKRIWLHPLISHFQRIAPTWLLFDQDWACTKQAVPYLGSCTDIIAIGRLIWIPGTKDTGKDNVAWYRFDARHTAGPIFHPWRSAPVSSHVSLCVQCSAPYRSYRSDSKYCGNTCRQRARRGRRDALGTPHTPIEPSDSSEVFRYVRHADVPRFTAEGWEPLPALDGTHHGEYSVLMRRVEQG